MHHFLESSSQLHVVGTIISLILQMRKQISRGKLFVQWLMNRKWSRFKLGHFNSVLTQYCKLSLELRTVFSGDHMECSISSLSRRGTKNNKKIIRSFVNVVLKMLTSVLCQHCFWKVINLFISASSATSEDS